MAGRSGKSISSGVIVIAAMIFLAPMCAVAWEARVRASSKSFPVVLINALGRETAFVKSFSVSYPGQFRQQRGGKKKMSTVAVEDPGARRR